MFLVKIKEPIRVCISFSKNIRGIWESAEGETFEPINQVKMAKEISGYVKLQCKGGQANPAP
ncbi:MAG TPA: hypothetical protein PLS00_10855, partial [Niabella sp.]|nr:hypothetical protein [Niabella sp.]